MRGISHASAASPRRVPAARLAVAAAAVSLAAAACGGGSSSDSSGGRPAVTATSSPDGTVLRLDRPLPKPELVLTDDQGRSFDLVERTAGKPTLVFFGYTHCPDVCPTTMADLANAVKTLPAADRRRLRVIFVTSDPARDTPERLHKWLAAFDARFIGLTGDFGAIRKAARGLGIALEKPVKNPDGGYTVTHGAQVLAFSPADDKVHLIYTSGTTSQQYAAHLPEIIKGQV